MIQIGFHTLPFLNEQKAVIAKVDSLLAACDELTAQNCAALVQAAQFIRRVLRETFQQNNI